MGEAKRRAASDPTFGRSPQRGPGLIVCPPIEILAEGFHVKSSYLDPQELRFALLFWNRLVWPSSTFMAFHSGPDEEFLEQAGILTRPSYSHRGPVSLVDLFPRLQVQAFIDLEEREPGLWALAQGENSLLIKNSVLEEGRGALVELTRAIPVPNRDVPLNDILTFRAKRRDELLRLRHEIESFFAAVNNATDPQFELRRHITQIDTACADILKVGREWRLPLRLADLKASFELRPFAALVAGAGGWKWGEEYEMPAITAALGVMAASLKINQDFGMRRATLRSSPYRYVYQFHTELF